MLPPVRVDRDSDDVIGAVRRAVGAEALFEAREGFTLTGIRTLPGARDPDERGAAPGERGTALPTILSARSNGDFLISTGSGEDASTRGFDGRDAWIADGRGVTRAVDLGSRETLLLDGWLRSQLWLAPGHQGLEVKLARGTPSDGAIRFEVRRPGEHVAAIVLVDESTMLPLEYTIERLGTVRRVAFEAWSTEAGLRLPVRLSEWQRGERVASDQFERRTPDTPPTFEMPTSRPSDVEFGTRAAALNTRIDPGGRYYVRAELDGKRALWLLLDTGFGANALSPRIAADSKLTPSGAVRLSGVSGFERSTIHEAVSLTLGPLTLHAPRFATIDTAHLSARAGFGVDGILGSPFFERAVVVLDGRAKTVSLFAPGALRTEGRAWARLFMDGSSPCLLGRIRAATVASPLLRYRLDTGSDDTLTVARWAVQRHDLDADRTRLRPTQLVGLFGELSGWRTKVAALEFGGIERRGMDVTLLTDEQPGPLADPWLAGNLGARALVGKRVVLDVARRRLAID